MESNADKLGQFLEDDEFLLDQILVTDGLTELFGRKLDFDDREELILALPWCEVLPERNEIGSGKLQINFLLNHFYLS